MGERIHETRGFHTVKGSDGTMEFQIWTARDLSGCYLFCFIYLVNICWSHRSRDRTQVHPVAPLYKDGTGSRPGPSL